MKSLKEFLDLDVTDTPADILMEVKGKFDPPNVLIMQRKSIRQFPGGKKVALYYIKTLDNIYTFQTLKDTTERTVIKITGAFDGSGQEANNNRFVANTLYGALDA